MKIATYNINGVNGHLDTLLRWLAERSPDVVCLQELKAPQEKFPLDAVSAAGYQAIWHGQKSWNGVAVLARTGLEMVEKSRILAGEDDDLQSRYLEVEIGGLTLINIYLPNGNPYPGPKFEYKLRWMQRLAARAEMLITAEKPAIICGDFNVIPTEADVYKPEKWIDDALFREEVRGLFGEIKAQGWTDAIRHLHPEEKIYTFWDYFRNAYGRDAGLRIDHFLVNDQVLPNVLAVGVDRHVRGWEKTSDHAPVWLEIQAM